MGNKYTEEFLRIVKENPNLPILPMVWEEVVAENSSCYWAGSFGTTEIKKVYCGERKWHFYDETDTEEQIDTLEDTRHRETSSVDYYEMDDGEIKEEYDNLPWKEYIVVYIELPD